MRNQRGIIPIGLILYAVAGLAIAGALFGLYRHGVTTGKASVQADWDKANKEQREREAEQAATASTKLETGNAKAKVITRTITVQVDKIIDRPIYRNVCLDDDGLHVARCSIRGEGADTCKPDKPVRSASVAGGWNGRLSLAMDYRNSSPLP